MGGQANPMRFLTGVAAGALALSLSLSAAAQTEQPQAGQTQAGQTQAGAASVSIELNKLEQQGDACRAYLLFENEDGPEYTVYRLDLVLFDDQGRIDRRIAVDASPLRAGKSVVKLFDLTGLQCDGISKILLNDIAPCEDSSGAREDCVIAAELRTLTDVSFYK